MYLMIDLVEAEVEGDVLGVDDVLEVLQVVHALLVDVPRLHRRLVDHDLRKGFR